MKVAMFQQAPYRYLPEDFQEHWAPAVTPPYHELADARGMADTMAAMLDELTLGARSGFDGVVLTEHGQAPYDITPNPSLPGAVMANLLRTEDLDAALIMLGRSLGKTREPVRIAEEYAMLDVMSGGRLIAGFPVGLSYDANVNQGIPGVDTRGRFREGYELLRKAWSSREAFAFNGRYSQYAHVNIWPRPVQDPHPPLWFPGSGNPGTMQWVLEQDAAFVLLTWFGVKMGGEGIFDRFWALCEEMGRDVNPHRVAVVQVCAVAETDERAEAEYGHWIEQGFRHGPGNTPPQLFFQPGYVPLRGLQGMLRSTADPGILGHMKDVTFAELADVGAAIVGSPATVRERLEAVCREMKVGNLLVMLQMGEMPHELAAKNVRMFSEEVQPHLQGMWEREGHSHDWWPTGIGESVGRASGSLARTSAEPPFSETAS
jgi:alkanesulfonate monooxygenase SsuD/methylene tetrahydromethanopterin reductase-like flavin-dependent oxidoreductase (luciferase family)